METTRYREWLDAYDADHSVIEHVNWLARLVHESYVPDENHTRSGGDVNGFIVASGGHIDDQEFVSNNMGTIMDTVMERFKTEVALNPSDMTEKVEELPGLSAEERQTLIDLAYRAMDDYDHTWWEDMRAAGAKYVVVESPNEDILCFCEELI